MSAQGDRDHGSWPDGTDRGTQPYEYIRVQQEAARRVHSHRRGCWQGRMSIHAFAQAWLLAGEDRRC